MKRIGRREFLGHAMLAAGLGAVRPRVGRAHLSRIGDVMEAGLPDPLGRAATLRDLAASKGLLFGCAFRSAWLDDEQATTALVARECSIIVPEYEMKWNVVEPRPGEFDYSRPERIAAFCATNKVALRGHALVWHESLPSWVAMAARDDAKGTLERHITNEVSRFAGRIHTWDVVNEPVDPSDHAPGAFRRTIWWQSLGPDYIALALRTAAQADPKARLAINENHLEYDDAYGRAKRKAVLDLLGSLKQAGVPLHVLGIQSHLRGDRPATDFKGFRQFLSEVAGLGLGIQITELDVVDAKLANDVATRDKQVADCYRDFLSIALDEPAVSAVLTWGVSDKTSWLGSFAPRGDKAPVRPLLWDDALHPKAAYTALANALRNAPRR